jgi:hypothetical protein
LALQSLNQPRRFQRRRQSLEAARGHRRINDALLLVIVSRANRRHRQTRDEEANQHPSSNIHPAIFDLRFISFPFSCLTFRLKFPAGKQIPDRERIASKSNQWTLGQRLFTPKKRRERRTRRKPIDCFFFASFVFFVSSR